VKVTGYHHHAARSSCYNFNKHHKHVHSVTGRPTRYI